MSDALSTLTRALDNIAEAKSDESDPFIMGVLAGVEDAIESAITDVQLWDAWPQERAGSTPASATAGYLPRFDSAADSRAVPGGTRTETAPDQTCAACGGTGDRYEDSMTLYGIPGGFDVAGPCPACDPAARPSHRCARCGHYEHSHRRGCCLWGCACRRYIASLPVPPTGSSAATARPADPPIGRPGRKTEGL